MKEKTFNKEGKEIKFVSIVGTSALGKMVCIKDWFYGTFANEGGRGSYGLDGYRVVKESEKAVCLEVTFIDGEQWVYYTKKIWAPKSAVEEEVLA